MIRLTPLAFALVLMSAPADAALPTAAPAAGESTLALDTRMILLPPAGTARDDREIVRWQERVRLRPAQPDGYERLGWAYVTKARTTLDAGYYKMAEKTADVMDLRFGATSDSRLLRGHILHNLHQFAAAEQIARQLVAERGLSFDYALLSDALMEQGKISESVQACTREMALKPGLEAYSRAANLRWLTGDLPGAIAAMEAAAKAGSPLDAANSAWTLARLSGYYLQAGDLARAALVAGESLRFVPDYPLGLLARARAAQALGFTGAALPDFQRAASLNPLPEYQWWLADALRSAGRIPEAAQIEAQLNRRGEVADPRTFALYLSTRHQEPAAALRLAREEIGNRDDVLTRDALAWAMLSGGDAAGAAAVMRTVLAQGTQDARLFLHAGEIAQAQGELVVAQKWFAAARPFAATLTPSERRLLQARLGAGPTLARLN
jgi:tetratricopeptide (TPR) repeat protein